jgi:hypothetical protein
MTPQIEKDSNLLTTLDIKNMYPSIRYKFIEQAVFHYSNNFDDNELVVINIGLEMLKFSISNCLITFRDKYYQYGTESNPVMRALSIGGFDSAWYADLVACYILDMTRNNWTKMSRYFKIYCDDGIGITKANKSVEEMRTWFESFQRIVVKLTSGDIVFTMEIWRPDEKSREIKKGIIDVIGGNSLPYLDTQMYYDKSGKNILQSLQQTRISNEIRQKGKYAH